MLFYFYFVVMFLGYLDLISCADLFIKSLLIFADFSENGYYDKEVVVELFWTRAKLCFTFFLLLLTYTCVFTYVGYDPPVSLDTFPNVFMFRNCYPSHGPQGFEKFVFRPLKLTSFS